MDSCRPQQTKELRKKNDLSVVVTIHDPPAVNPVNVSVNVSPESKKTMSMQTPNILQFECRRCQVIHVSPFTERRAEDEVLSYSGYCAQSFLNLSYCHSRWQIPLETELVDEFWAGKDCSPQHAAQRVVVPLRFHVRVDGVERAASSPEETAARSDPFHSEPCRLASFHSADSR